MSRVDALLAMTLIGAISFLIWLADASHRQCEAKTCSDPNKGARIVHGQCICVEVPK